MITLRKVLNFKLTLLSKESIDICVSSMHALYNLVDRLLLFLATVKIHGPTNVTKYGFSINLIVKIMEGQGDHFENICQKVMTGKRSQKISLLVFKDNHNETQLLHYITYLPTCYFALFMGEVFLFFSNRVHFVAST